LSKRTARKPRLSFDQLGSALGKLDARLKALKAQRNAIASEIQAVMDAAKAMLGDLAGGDAKAPAAPRTRNRKGGRPKGFKVSDETKRKLRAAWERRRRANKG